MLTSAILLLATSAVAEHSRFWPNQSDVTIRPGLYTLRSLAPHLSSGGEPIRVVKSIENRVVAISITRRPLNSVLEQFSRHLGLSLVKTEDGSLELRPDAQAGRKDLQKLQGFTTSSAGQLDRLVSGGGELLERAVDAETKPSGEALVRSAIALGLSLGVAYQSPGQLLEYLLRSGFFPGVSLGQRYSPALLTSAIRGSSFDVRKWQYVWTSNALSVAKKLSMEPDWQSIIPATADPGSFAATFRDHRYLASRLSFEPRYCRFVLEDYQLDQLTSFGMPRPIRLPTLPPGLLTSTNDLDRAEPNPKATRELLRSEWAKTPHLLKRRDPSMALVLLASSMKASKDLIAEVSPIRDNLLASGQSLMEQYWPKLMAAQPNTDIASVTGTYGELYWLSLLEDKGTIIGLNQMRFVDEWFYGPSAKLEPLFLTVAEPADQHFVDLKEACTIAGSLTSVEVASMCRSTLELRCDGFRIAAPFLAFLSSLPPTTLKSVLEGIEAGKTVVLNARATSSSAIAKLTGDCRGVIGCPDLAATNAFYSSVLLRPDSQALVGQSIVEIVPIRNKSEVRLDIKLRNVDRLNTTSLLLQKENLPQGLFDNRSARLLAQVSIEGLTVDRK